MSIKKKVVTIASNAADDAIKPQIALLNGQLQAQNVATSATLVKFLSPGSAQVLIGGQLQTVDYIGSFPKQPGDPIIMAGGVGVN